MKLVRHLIFFLFLLGSLAGQSVPPPEVAVTLIPLDGPVAGPDAELSGLAWYGDHLILLPQWPHWFDNHLFAIPRADILAFLDGRRTEPIVPRPVPFIAPAIRKKTALYRGLEAIAFDGDRVFIIVEGSRQPPTMSFLMAGAIAPDLSAIRIDTDNIREIMPRVPIPNFSDESLIISGRRLLTLYEANGANINPHPLAHRFDFGLAPVDSLPLSQLEYRLTDATALDDRGRFWATNYFFPGELGKLLPAADPLAARFGQGSTHGANHNVERLVEFQVSDTAVTLTATPPIQLQLLGNDTSRNWEGIVRLEGRGFLLVTDRFPETFLAFVPWP